MVNTNRKKIVTGQTFRATSSLRPVQALTGLGLVCSLMLSPLLAWAQQIGVVVNDQPVVFQGIGPQQIEGRVLVPVRGVLEKIGANVQWVPQTQTVVAGNGQIDITLKIGDRHATVNTRDVMLDVPAQVISGYTFVPLRFLGEALGAEVRWDAQNQTVVIHTRPGGDRNIAGRDRDRGDIGERNHRTPRPGGPEPVINSFVQDSRPWLRAGDTVHVLLEGTPGGQAEFRIPGLVEGAPMREVAPGRYQGEWQAPNDRPLQSPETAVIGSLKVGDRSSQLIQAARPVAVDTIPPQFKDRSPDPDSHVGSPRPSIYAVFTDQGSGVDPGSVRLLLNGRDVTANATVSREFISYTPPAPLPGGPTTVQIIAADRAGNRSEADWKFIEDRRDDGGIRAIRCNADHRLQPGDTLHVEIDGTPGSKGDFSLGNIQHIPFTERSPGRYVADYAIRRGDDVNNARLTAHLLTSDGAKFERQSDNGITVATGKPLPPQIIYPGAHDTPGNPLVIRGKASPNARIHVTVDYRSKVLNVLAVKGTALDAMVQADRNGNWATQPVALNGLLNSRDVDYTISAVSVNNTGDQSDAAATHFHLR
jgi:hypothetical protein